MLHGFEKVLLGYFLWAAAPAADLNWHSLFDGKTFAGREDPAKKSPLGDSFTIQDGCLKATAHPPTTEDLFTRDTFRDFELEFDWKISPRGNSGVKYRIQDRVWVPHENAGGKFEDQVNAGVEHRVATRPARGQEYVVGFEYRITDNGGNPDAVHNGPLHRTAALYDMIAASREVTRPVGEFNHSRLVVRGDRIEHWLNREKVVASSLKAPEIAAGVGKRWGVGSPVYDLLAKQPRRECQISLQNHGDEAWFKHIRIRRL